MITSPPGTAGSELPLPSPACTESGAVPDVPPLPRRAGVLLRLRKVSLRGLLACGILLAAALGGLALGVVTLADGVRFPPLRLEPSPRPATATLEGALHVEAKGASLVREAAGRVVFRAHVLEPVLVAEAERDARAELILENVHPDARVVQEGGARVLTSGATRRIGLSLRAGRRARVRFVFPERRVYRFAAIGDTGSQGELRWSLERAVALGADFVLHLGDVAYSSDDFPRVARTLRAIPVPVFAAIGNHDMDGPLGRMGERFTRTLGPRNSRFTLGGVTFVNLDTAAATWPVMSGERGRLLRSLGELPETERTPLVVFTHRPLNDPEMESGEKDEPHALNSFAESTWLRRTLLELGARVLLTGHIHQSLEFDDEGLYTYISGDGLGHRDQGTAAAVSRILVGSFPPGGPVRFHWEPLAMPRALLEAGASRE